MISSLSSSTSTSASDFFSRIDTDSDGKLSAAELKTDFESHLKKKASSQTDSSQSGTSTPPTPDFAQMISDNDTDGDGSLSEVEFTSGMQARHQMPPPPPPETSSTDTTDTSTDDSSSTLAAAISELDTDGDGKLSAAELMAAYLAKTQTATTADSTTTTDSTSSTSAASTTASPDFTSLIAAIDADGDGLLNSDELSSLITDSRRAQQPPPPPPMMSQNAAWQTAEDETTSTSIGEA